MNSWLLRDVRVVNEGRTKEADVLVRDGFIERVATEGVGSAKGVQEFDAKGKHLLPGAIDDQVHFREPGLTYKEDIAHGSAAAVAGGITTFMEMPNTIPQTLTQELLEAKYAMGAASSVANYSFYMGASNTNVDEVLRTDPRTVCGLKAFLGSSTGNMLVDNPETLDRLFKEAHLILAIHAEDEPTIRRNMAEAVSRYGEDIPMEQHPLIRSEEACWLSSSNAVALAKKHGTRLHVLHISTARELELFAPGQIDGK
ncbi:MAG: amidohydrolase family protein, partial [Flavobacteriales bacterium]